MSFFEILVLLGVLLVAIGAGYIAITAHLHHASLRAEFEAQKLKIAALEAHLKDEALAQIARLRAKAEGK